MNDEQFFLANAYLDGELTADERAIAEADPAVMAEVEELRALQALIRDVDPPSATAREDAIAAAMAEFGAAGAVAASPPAHSTGSAPATPATPSTPSSVPIPFRPRPAYAKYLAVAAGVLGVGLLGVAVANLPGGGDDSAEDSAAQPAAEEPAELPADDAERLTEVLADDAAEDVAGGEAAGDAPAAEMATAEEPASEPAAEPADEPASEPAEEPASEPAAAPAEEPASDDVGPRPALAPDQVLTTPEELGSFGTGLLEQQLDGTLPPTPNHACDVDEVLGTAEYLAGDIQRTVLVAVDEAVDLVLAFDTESCEYVAQGPLYEPFAP